MTKKGIVVIRGSGWGIHYSTLQHAHRYRAVVSHFTKKLRLLDFYPYPWNSFHFLYTLLQDALHGILAYQTVKDVPALAFTN